MTLPARLVPLLLLPLLTGCLASRPPPAAPPRAPPISTPASAQSPAVETPLVAPPAAPPSSPAPEAVSLPTVIDIESGSIALGAGRSLIDVHVPSASFVSIGVFGPQGAL